MRFLVAGGYSGGNPGDEAILKSTLYELDASFPGSFFGIWTSHDEFRPRFDRPIDHEILSWRPLPWTHGTSLGDRALMKLYVDTFPLSRSVVRAMSGRDRRVEDAIRGYDKVIFVGGGYINSDYAIAEMNFLAGVAERLGKPSYLLGQTLGPFRKTQHARMARQIFGAARAVVLRDEDSRSEVEAFAAKVFLGSDHAIAFEPRISGEDRLLASRYVEDGAVNVGINLRLWRDSRNYYAEVARALSEFAAFVPGGRLRLVFVPMETGPLCDDREEGDLFGDYLPQGLDYRVVWEPLSVEARHHLISRLHLFAGMRLHSLVFALACGVPTIGIYHDEYYRRKIGGLFERFRMPGLAIPIQRAGEMGRLLRGAYSQHDRMRERILDRRDRIVKDQHEIVVNVIGGKT